MDRYSLNARIYPIVIFYMPAVILAVLFSLKFDKYVHLFTSFGIVGALSYLFSQLGRDGGKIKEKEQQGIVSKLLTFSHSPSRTFFLPQRTTFGSLKTL